MMDAPLDPSLPGGTHVAAILWALDDTLLDTRAPRLRALATAFERALGQRVDPLDVWRSNRGGAVEELARRVAGDAWRQFIAAYNDAYNDCRPTIRPHPGIEAVLERFAEADTPMAVITSRVSWGATEELQRAGILKYFRAIVGSDDCDHQKPDPEPVFEAIDRMLIDQAASAVLIGASPADVFAARNAGCLSVAAAWGTLDEGLLLDAHPDYVARTPADLPGILEAIEGGVAP